MCTRSLLFLPLLHTCFHCQGHLEGDWQPEVTQPSWQPDYPSGWDTDSLAAGASSRNNCLKSLVPYWLCQSPRPAPSHFLCSAQTHNHPFNSLQTPVL